MDSSGAKSIAGSQDGSTNRPIAWWVRLVVILAALLTAVGAIIALVNPIILASPQDQINGAVHIYAGYMAARNLAIAFALVALLAMGARRALGYLMLLVGLIQFLDGCIDAFEARWAIAPGVLILALIFFASGVRLSGGISLWRREVWE
jgi:hypothetical protein